MYIAKYFKITFFTPYEGDDTCIFSITLLVAKSKKTQLKYKTIFAALNIQIGN